MAELASEWKEMCLSHTKIVSLYSVLISHRMLCIHFNIQVFISVHQ
jgi:hypothetical protein